MKPVIFRARAERDLLGIIEYYSEFSQDTAQNVLNDIYRAIDQLSFFPHSGREIDRRDYRRIVTHKYHFQIGYEVVADSVNIIGIFRYQDREI